MDQKSDLTASFADELSRETQPAGRYFAGAKSTQTGEPTAAD